MKEERIWTLFNVTEVIWINLAVYPEVTYIKKKKVIFKMIQQSSVGISLEGLLLRCGSLSKLYEPQDTGQ